MEVLDARGDPPPAHAVASAATALRAGQVIGIPTDTVYGLAVDPFVPGASARVFTAKRRPRGVHLAVLVSGVDQALSLVGDVPPAARRLIDAYWPGALTLVLRRREGLAIDLGDDAATVGVRCPAHPLSRALCAAAGPLATTSANLHGEPPLTTAPEVADTFAGRVGLVLDAGPCAGIPSSVVDCTGDEPIVLREGAVSAGEVQGAARGPR